ncbi:MAG: glycosyl hydrolase, partial [Gammaproteobacteria bacterium]|nr:glycosyl hydrolase [Gammaproteobacteria bacterium]
MKQLILLLALWCCTTQALPGDYLAQQPTKADFALVGKSSVATIQLDDKDHKGLKRAVQSLQQDIQKVSGKSLSISPKAENKQLLIIGSLGNNALLDQLVATGKLDVKAIQGRWEAYLIQVIEQPLPGVEQALVIVGSDKRGAIFGVYDLAETIGVSPWNWWADVPVKQQP